jgi:hypothetical protein
MADIIEFLERMGRDAQLRHAPDAVLEQAMRAAQLSASARAALMGGDRADLEAVIGREGNVCCLIHTPEPGGEEMQPKSSTVALGIDKKVCCVVFAPEPDGPEQQPKSRKAVVGIDEKVCCMVNVPLPEGEDESEVTEGQKAA